LEQSNRRRSVKKTGPKGNEAKGEYMKAVLIKVGNRGLGSQWSNESSKEI